MDARSEAVIRGLEQAGEEILRLTVPLRPAIERIRDLEAELAQECAARAEETARLREAVGRLTEARRDADQRADTWEGRYHALKAAAPWLQPSNL
jgi:hypothetical protein